MRRKVDQIRDYLYGAAIPTAVQRRTAQFPVLFYMIEGIDAANVRQSKATGRGHTSLFAGDWTLRNPLNARPRG